jgi:hypothetical protein
LQIYKHIELDDFEKGCLLEGGHDFGLVFKFESSSIDQIKKELRCIADFSRGEEFEGRFETQQTENADGLPASPSEIDSWKRGEIQLWCASYSAYLFEITREPLNAFEYLNDTKKTG